MFQRILVPVDFSPCSESAIGFARTLVGDAGQLRLLYVIDPRSLSPFGGLVELEKLRTHAARSLRELAAEHEAGSRRVETELGQGTIYKVIQEKANLMGADAVVLGSHGRRGLSRFLMGSVAERVVRDTKRPVAVVKQKPPPGLSVLGLGTDFSDSAAASLFDFRRLLERHGCRGLILHVIDPDALMPGPGSQAILEENRLRLTEKMGEQLESVVAEFRDAGLDVEGRLLTGAAWEQLSQEAEKSRIDLLVLGTHGYTGIDRFVLGSVAEKTLRSTRCPVLIVPSGS